MDPVERLLRRVGWVLLRAGVVVLGAFGLYFSFANYPWVAVGILLLILVLTGHTERTRRAKQKARQAARRRDRLR